MWPVNTFSEFNYPNDREVCDVMEKVVKSTKLMLNLWAGNRIQDFPITSSKKLTCDKQHVWHVSFKVYICSRRRKSEQGGGGAYSSRGKEGASKGDRVKAPSLGSDGAVQQQARKPLTWLSMSWQQGLWLAVFILFYLLASSCL